MNTIKVITDEQLELPVAGERVVRSFCCYCHQELDLGSCEPFVRIRCPYCKGEMPVPLWFGNFLLEEPCGIGGMASVYRALDPKLDREVALKLPHRKILEDSAYSKRFLHEARVAATLNHGSVVPVYSCGIHGKQPYLVMQYMSGGTLEWKLKTYRGFLPMGTVCQWIHDIAQALEYALKHGIVHHDVKPANILLDAEGKAKIGDFGLAAELKNRLPRETEGKEDFWFSPLYASPEKIRTGKENYSGDIYSLAATFYHLITGTPPFLQPDTRDLLQLHLSGKPVPPDNLRPEIPKKVTELILWMLEKDPLDRPTYHQIIMTLEEILQNPQEFVHADEASGVMHSTQMAGSAVRFGVSSSLLPVSEMKNKQMAADDASRKNPIVLTAISAFLCGVCICLYCCGMLFTFEAKKLIPGDFRYSSFFPESFIDTEMPAERNKKIFEPEPYGFYNWSPDLVWAVSRGNSVQVWENALNRRNQKDIPPEDKVLACLQMAIACYLCDFQNKPEQVRQIYIALLNDPELIAV